MFARGVIYNNRQSLKYKRNEAKERKKIRRTEKYRNQIIILCKQNKTRGYPHGVMVKVIDYRILVSEFEFQSRLVFFNHLILPAVV